MSRKVTHIPLSPLVNLTAVDLIHYLLKWSTWNCNGLNSISCRRVSFASKTVKVTLMKSRMKTSCGRSSRKVQPIWELELNSSKAAIMFLVMFAFQVSWLCLSLCTKFLCVMFHTFLNCTVLSLHSFSFFTVYVHVHCTYN